MDYYLIAVHDHRQDVFIFQTLDSNDIPVLRELYRPLACKKCGKFDEDKALKLGLAKDIKVPSVDFCLSWDDCFIIVSKKVKASLQKAKVKGVKFIPIPKNPNFILIPTIFLTIKNPKKNCRFLGQCKVCGRYREVKGLPQRENGLEEVPPKNSIYTTNFPMEGTRAKTPALFATPEVIDLLKRNRFSGAIYIKW